MEGLDIGVAKALENIDSSLSYVISGDVDGKKEEALKNTLCESRLLVFCLSENIKLMEREINRLRQELSVKVSALDTVSGVIRTNDDVAKMKNKKFCSEDDTDFNK